MEKRQKKLQGFSLGELLVVIVIVTLLALAILMGYQTQIAKANDARRKEDFSKFKIAFEDYYNDISCYPAQSNWDAVTCTCESDCLSPYMEKLLCDPVTRQKYYYVQLADCKGYQLYAKLQNRGDPDIERVGCSWIRGCGEGELSKYNYGIAMGGSVTAAGFNPNPTNTNTPTPAGGSCLSATGPIACSVSGLCEDLGAGAFLPDPARGGRIRCSRGFPSDSDCCRLSGCSITTSDRCIE